MNRSYVSKVTDVIDQARDDLVSISMDIHSHPELNFEEHYSCNALCVALEKYGFEVERGVGGVETAFRATLNGSGGDGPTVAFLAEYDALPGIGHGCGHNLIAISNLGAGIGAMAALGELPGKIVFTGIDAMRQHLRSDVRIHGIITNGGKAPNVVPDFASANFMLRCTDRKYLEYVVEKVLAVAEGAAKMTGAELKVVPEQPMYENVIPNVALSASVLANADASGLKVINSIPGENVAGGSTDFGNVSQVMPSYYAKFAVATEPVPAHSLAMAAAAKTNYAQDVAISVAKALALTACDILSDPSLLAAAKEEFKQRTQA